MLTKQRRYLNFTRISFYTLFLAKGVTGYKESISSRLYVRLKGTCWLASQPSTFKHRLIN